MIHIEICELRCLRVNGKMLAGFWGLLIYAFRLISFAFCVGEELGFLVVAYALVISLASARFSCSLFGEADGLEVHLVVGKALHFNHLKLLTEFAIGLSHSL